MNFNFKSIALFLGFLVLVNTAFSQQMPRGGRPGAGQMPKITISGKVVDEDTKEALELSLIHISEPTRPY